MNDRVFSGKADRLRSPERIALLEVERVTDLCLYGVNVAGVLDVGTGSGVFAESFASRGLQVSGIDANPEMVDLARRHVPGGEFRTGSAEQMPYPDQSFDLVFLGHVLHETDDGVEALKQAGRVARKRVAVLEWPFLEEQKGPPLAHRLSPERVIELAREAGLNRVERIKLDHMDLYLMDK